MATITLTGNTNVSALSLANNDTIDLAGFVLTFNAQPAVTGIQVTTPGTAGTCVFSVTCVIPTWGFFAGTVALISSLPVGCSIGSATGGTGAFSRGVVTNEGEVGVATGGSGGNSQGVATNNAKVGVAIGGTGTNVSGVAINNGTIETATGAGGGGTHGVQSNNGTVVTANGGSSVSSRGVSANNGTVLRAFDSVGLAIDISRGDFKLVNGPDFQTTINNPNNDITTIYSIGPLSNLATVPVGATVIELSAGGGAAFQLVGGGGLVY
jgi:hypothetical protein